MRSDSGGSGRAPWEERADGKIHTVLPDIGDKSRTGEIVKWLVAPGQVVIAMQPVVHVMYNRATVEIPAPLGGVITDLHFSTGTEAKIGDTLFSMREPIPM